ncbi:hypothetical protein DERF_008412 [Dermatophagoides farinae]|uniref:Complex 1 LYR protein domain-containing protein n=1 Tax=Dermatophagoides farinae TaxID=6954 RepID=A0A922L5G1_DERFA|nr:MIEF1 upstream open reading frame protein-like [Dermatophagoides farinae]KAH9517780.1 hypothetical protein DERF_008412 [Dermatophagoides farinae]
MCINSTTKIITRSCVRRLYKDLLRFGRNELQYTNKDYFCQRIRKEFRVNRNLDRPEDIEYYYKKGLTLLQKRAIV